MSVRRRRKTKATKAPKKKRDRTKRDDDGIPVPPKKREWKDGRGDMAADEGTPMENNENPCIFQCLTCQYATDRHKFKPTGKFEGMKNHCEK